MATISITIGDPEAKIQDQEKEKKQKRRVHSKQLVWEAKRVEAIKKRFTKSEGGLLGRVRVASQSTTVRERSQTLQSGEYKEGCHQIQRRRSNVLGRTSRTTPKEAARGLSVASATCPSTSNLFGISSTNASTCYTPRTRNYTSICYPTR